MLAGIVVRDRSDGRERFVVTNMNENSGCELIFIDFERDEARVCRAPAGAGSWALREVSGDRLVVGTFYDGAFMVFDLVSMSFTHVAQVPGENYIWNLAVGGDGRIYGGTYGGGKLASFDLDDGSVEDCGAPAPPNMYLRHVSSLPDGRILCSLGQSEPTTKLYDPATREFADVPDSIRAVQTGVSWRDRFLVGNRAFAGVDLREEAVPFAAPGGAGGWSIEPALMTQDSVVIRQGSRLYRASADGSEATLIADLDLRSGWLLASAEDGSILGVRGQDYFRFQPGDTALDLRRIPGESGPRATLFLAAAPDGSLWGGPSFGQTLCRLDPATGEYSNTGAVCDAGGEVYAVAFHDGKTVAASYSGGDITLYDPGKPWDQVNHRNPKPVASVGSLGYIRPTGGIVVQDGVAYTGWMARYGVYGGAVAVTDIETGSTRLVENPLGEQAVEGLAVADGSAYVGTSLSANGLPGKPDDAPRFGVIDLGSGAVRYSYAFEGRSSVRAVVIDPSTGWVCFCVDGRLHRFDEEALAVHPIDSDPSRVSSRNLLPVGDGSVLYGSGRTLVHLDLRSGTSRALVEAPESISNLAQTPDGVVFASAGTGVYRVPRIA